MSAPLASCFAIGPLHRGAPTGPLHRGAPTDQRYSARVKLDPRTDPDVPKGMSIALLQDLHLLTRDGHLNADARRKLKQIRHLVGLLRPALDDVLARYSDPVVVDCGAGKSYLGALLYELVLGPAGRGSLTAIEARPELSAQAARRAERFGQARFRVETKAIGSFIAPTQHPDAERADGVQTVAGLDGADEGLTAAAAAERADGIAAAGAGGGAAERAERTAAADAVASAAERVEGIAAAGAAEIAAAGAVASAAERADGIAAAGAGEVAATAGADHGDGAPTAAGASPSRRPNIVTALHACDTATDDALVLAIAQAADHVAVVPCCQAEVARQLESAKTADPVDAALFAHPLHRRELGSHLTNVIRALVLQAHGYKVTVTELVGWEHSAKNELILGRRVQRYHTAARQTLRALLDRFGVEPQLVRELTSRGLDPRVDPT